MGTASPATDTIDRLQTRLASLEQERKHLLTVIEILQDLIGTRHFADIVQSVTQRLGHTFGLDRCSIFLVERAGRTVRLVASYENPGIRNYVVDLDRYPELRRALDTGETVFIADAIRDPSLAPAHGILALRRVQSITAIPITWQRAPIGAILLRTFRDGPAFSEADVDFCRVVAHLTGKALYAAHRFERVQQRRTRDESGSQDAREYPVFVELLRTLLATYPPSRDHDGKSPGPSPEIERLTGVIRTVLQQESAIR